MKGLGGSIIIFISVVVCTVCVSVWGGEREMKEGLVCDGREGGMMRMIVGW